MRTLPLVLLALWMLPTSITRADGLLHRLPEDGTWCTCTLKSTFHPTKKGDEPMTLEGRLTLASVGTETVKDEKCRWIELVIDVTQPGAPGGKGLKTIMKGLIPEKYLAKGQNPSGRWLKGWMKLGDFKQQELTPEALANPSLKLNLFVSGPLQESKALEKKEIETGLGKLACDGVTGTLLVKGAFSSFENGKVTVGDAKINVQLYSHEKAPFGVAWARYQMAGPPGREKHSIDETLTLKGVGKGAKSQLPVGE